jgi:predicted DNA-binding transcriptional regulator AlpA
VATDLVSVTEIATMLNVSRQRVDQLIQAYDDFPAPEAELAIGRVWLKSAIEAWANTHPRRPGRPPLKR